MTDYRMDPEPDVDTLWGVPNGGDAWVTLTREVTPDGTRWRTPWRTPSGVTYAWPQVLDRFERVTDENPDPFADYPLPWKCDGEVISAANGRVAAAMDAPPYGEDIALRQLAAERRALAAVVVAAVNAYGAQLPAREATA